MFRRSEQIWKQYPQDIIAVNNQEALYLLHYLTYIRMTRHYLSLVEIIDLQHYRIIRKKQKISALLSLKGRDADFLFPIYKN